MDIVFIIAILAFSLYRTWKNAFFPLVFIIFINSLEFWAKTRLPFFYENKNILDFYFLGLVAVAFYRHVLPDLSKNGIRLTRVELSIMLLICYSWLSYNWGPGSAVFEERPILFMMTIVNQIVYIILLPFLFRSALGKYNLYTDIAMVSLIVAPVIALTTDWDKGRGAVYLFQVINQKTGGLVESAFNPLQIGFFGSVLILFNVFYFRKTVLGIASFLVAVPLGFYLLIEVQTRGQLFAVLFCLLVFMPFVFRSFRLRYYIMIAPLIFAVIVFTVMNISQIITVVFDMIGYGEYAQRYSMDILIDRFDMRATRTAVIREIWQNSPMAILTGLGTASSEYYVGSYIHNLPLEVLFEQGLAGFMIYSFAIVTALLSIYRMLVIENINKDDRRLAVFISSFFIFWMVVSLKQSALYASFFVWLATIMPAILSNYFINKYRYIKNPALNIKL